MNTREELEEVAKEVVELENQLVKVLDKAPMHVGVMAMSRLIAAAGIRAGRSPEYMAEGIKLAGNTILERKECGHAQSN